jgi:DNA-binding beta-propeller fold protein YncE
MTVNSEGNLLIAAPGRRKIYEYAPQGWLRETHWIVLDGDTTTPQSVFWHGKRCYVKTPDEFLVFDRNWQLQRRWQNRDRPTARVIIAVDDAGSVFASASTLTIKYSATGDSLLSWLLVGQSSHTPVGGIAVAQQKLFVTNLIDGEVIRYDLEGNEELTWGRNGSGPGQFYYPAEIAVDDQGFLFILDSGNTRIQKFDVDGRYLGEFGSRISNDNIDWPLEIATDGTNMFVSHPWARRIRRYGF